MSNDHDDEIAHRRLDTGRTEPVTQIAEIVAELKGVREDSLTTTYEKIDHVLANIFSEPPKPEAQVEVTFSYEGFRITVEQNGRAQFVRTSG